MSLYSIATDAIRAAEIALRPLSDKESCSVHIRSTGQIVITRARIDKPEIISERICGFDDTL